MSVMPLLLDTTIKVSIIVVLALAATVMLRKQSAALRHWVLAAAIVCAAATPLFTVVVPAWDFRRVEPPTGGLTWRPIRRQPSMYPRVRLQPEDRQQESRTGADQRLDRRRRDRPGGAAHRARAAGVARFEIPTGQRRNLARSGRRRVPGARAPTPGAAPAERPPYAAGHLGTRVAEGDPASRRVRMVRDRVRIVLCHELAHIRRGDWVVQLAAQLVRSIYWFNPILWMACARLRLESEQACDDRVLNLGVERTEYATQLLDLARTFKKNGRTLSFGSPAPAIAHPSSLERRIRAMLNAGLNRAPLTRSTCIATTAALLIVTASIAGFGASAQSGAASFSGALMDAIGRILPDTADRAREHTEQRETRSTQRPVRSFSVRRAAGGRLPVESGASGF